MSSASRLRVIRGQLATIAVERSADEVRVMAIRVIVADDSLLVREGIRILIGRQSTRIR